MIRLYNPRPRVRQSYKDVKVITLPSQSMSLREIIRRFVRNESLPVSQEGFYEDRFEDLEKLGNYDITVQLEKAEEYKNKLSRIRNALEKQGKEKEEEKESPPTPPPTSPPTPPKE